MKIVLNAIILMFSVICIIAFLLFVENITLETHFLSREMINAIVYGWLGLYLLRLYWSYSQKETGVTKNEQYERYIQEELIVKKQKESEVKKDDRKNI